MKTKIVYIFILMITIVMNACDDEKLSDSIFDTSPPERNTFDKWLYSNLIQPYNIDLKYKFEEIETELNGSLIPADYNKAQKIAQILKFGWIDVYDNVTRPGFVRENAPKVIHLVGSPAYNSDGSETIANIDAGMKVTLFNINRLSDPIDPNQINQDYFRILHHEFAHILNQKKVYDSAFSKLSYGKYIKGQWINAPFNNARYANSNGFVSSYAMSFPDEDFSETFSIYLSYSNLDWNNLLEQAGDEGSIIIIKKLDFIKLYFKNKWSIDVEKLRNAVQDKVGSLQLYEFEELI